MSISFEDFLKSAEILLKNPHSTEIDFRNAISRSYYAMFHLSQEVSAKLEVTVEYDSFNKLGSHERIFNSFKNHSDKNIQQLAEWMYKCKNARVRADYHINETVGYTEATRHFNAIKRIIQKLKQLPN